MLDAEEAYQQYRDMVYGYLIRLCRDRDLAEELTQETFYQAMKNWKRYEGKSSVGTWLCAIARNQFLRIMRKQSPLPLDDVPGAIRPGFHGDGRGTQSRPECASSSPPSAGTVSRGVHPENLLRIVQQGDCGAVREIRKLGARNGVPGEANAAGRDERRMQGMKQECEIVRDLMPLVLDDVASDGSKHMVSAHVQTCAQCAAY